MRDAEKVSLPLLKTLFAAEIEEVGNMLATAACNDPVAVGMTSLALLVTLARMEGIGGDDARKATLIPLKTLFKPEFGTAEEICKEVTANDSGFNPEISKLRSATTETADEVKGDIDGKLGVAACGMSPDKVDIVVLKALEMLYKPDCSAPPATELVCTGRVGMSAACAAGKANNTRNGNIAKV